MESDTSSEQRFVYSTCITVYPLLITRIVSHCDIKRLLNEYIFKGDNAHHEKYMIINSGSIENGQFSIYFTNNVSAESIYESMKSEGCFSCSIPRKQFMTQPNKDRFIPNSIRKWRWKKEINLNQDFTLYSFENCYQIEHALENKHDTVILSIKERDHIKDQENKDINTQNADKKRKSIKMKSKNNDQDIVSWHLIIFNEEYSKKNKNVANICKTAQIEIESETCYHGMVTNIDSDTKTGYVRNRDWKAIHSFKINAQYDHKLQSNALISYTLSIPKSCYVSSEPITAKDCIARNIDIMSGAMLSRRNQIKYPDKLNGDLMEFHKLSLLTPSNSSSGSPIMFLSPKRREIHGFTMNQPQRRHSVASGHHHRSKSRLVQIYDTNDLHGLLIGSKSTPYRVHIQSKTMDLRNISREVSLSISGGKLALHSPSPSPSIRSIARSLSPLSEIGDNYIAPKTGNITPSSSSMESVRIENSESREKAERYCLLDMASWSEDEFLEFLNVIGEKDFIDLFKKNSMKANHLKLAEESMLRSLGLPLIHIKNILMERDYYKNADRELRSLAELNVNEENHYTLELKLKELKTIMNNSRVSRLKLQRLKCRKFALKHHEVVQIIKEYIERINNALKDTEDTPGKLEEGELKETIGWMDEEEEEKEMRNDIVVFRAERELIEGCNRFAGMCIGCVSLQLMNMNYLKFNFGESSVGLVLLYMEKELIERVNGLLSMYPSARVHVYKSMDIFYYTLIICGSKGKDCLGFKGFTGFLKDDLSEIGFKIPLYWKRDSDKRLLWKRSSVGDIYSDIDKFEDMEQLEGISKSGGLEFDASDIEYSTSKYSMSRASQSLSPSKSFYLSKQRSVSSVNMDKVLTPQSMIEDKNKEMSKLKTKNVKSPSKFKSLRKSFAKRLSISGKKKKKKNKSKKKSVCKNELGGVDEENEFKQLEELREYGFDNDSLSLSERKQIYFMMGSIHVGMQQTNLYQEIQKVRRTIHKNLVNRSEIYQNKEQLKGDMIDVSSVNDLFFVKRL